MARFDLTAGARYTDAAQLLEKFLDDNAENIAPNLFDELDDLAGEIETAEENYKSEIEQLKQEKEDLETEKEELQNELEALK